MPYGTIKVDNITFDNGGTDKLLTVSGLFFSTSGALTVTGAISGGNVTAPTATFTTFTGTTTAGTTATFTSGSFTSLTGVTTTVTSGIFGLGSAAAPSIAISGNPNTGIYSPGPDTLAFVEGGTEAVRIDSSGRLLVGTSSSLVSTSLVQVASTNYPAMSVNSFGTSSNPEYIFRSARGTQASPTVSVNDDKLGAIYFQGYDGVEYISGAKIEAFVDGAVTGGGTDDLPGRLVFSVTPDGGSSPTTSPSAMTINSGQEVLIGYSTDNGAYKLQVNSQIFATSATIATSDGRYKENVVTLDDCVDLVKALRPVSFDWKHQEPITRINEEGEIVVVREAHNFPDGAQVGFIAQEVQEVLAEKHWLTSVIKQNIRPAINDSDGNELAPEEEFFGIAEGNLVAVLTSALKDAIGRIESLEAEVAALKA